VEERSTHSEETVVCLHCGVPVDSGQHPRSAIVVVGMWLLLGPTLAGGFIISCVTAHGLWQTIFCETGMFGDILAGVCTLVFSVGLTYVSAILLKRTTINYGKHCKSE